MRKNNLDPLKEISDAFHCDENNLLKSTIKHIEDLLKKNEIELPHTKESLEKDLNYLKQQLERSK